MIEPPPALSGGGLTALTRAQQLWVPPRPPSNGHTSAHTVGGAPSTDAPAPLGRGTNPPSRALGMAVNKRGPLW